MTLPKTISKYEHLIQDYSKGSDNDLGYCFNEDSDKVYHFIELKFPYLFGDSPTLDFDTLKEAAKSLKNVTKDLEGMHYDILEVLEVLTDKQEIETLKSNMSNEELAKLPKEKKVGRPVGTTKENKKKARIEFRTTEDKKVLINQLIKENKKKYGLKNIDDVLLKILKESL